MNVSKYVVSTCHISFRSSIMGVPYVRIGPTNMRVKEGCSLGSVSDDSVRAGRAGEPNRV